MNTLLIAEADDALRKELSRRVRNSGIRAARILEYSNEEEALEYLRKNPVDVLIADRQMETLWKSRGAEQSSRRGLPLVILVGSGGSFACAVDMMRLGVRDYFTVPAAPGLLENRLFLLEEEIGELERFRAKGMRVFCAHLRYLLLHPETFEEGLLEDMESFFREHLREEEAYRAVIACEEAGPLPVEPEITLKNMEGGSLYLICERKARKLMSILEDGGFLGISREHVSLGEIFCAYREAAEAKKVAYVCCRPWEEYHDYFFENTEALEKWKEKYLYEFSVDRLAMVEKKPRQWFFEGRHLHVSPFQLIQVMEELCGELNRFCGDTDEQISGIPPCPMPQESPNADIFLERFEEWTETCRENFFDKEISPQNVKKIRRAMDFIRENYRRDLNMATVSNYVSMNYTLFSNEFKKYCGVNFVNYLKEIRIQEAKRLLEETDQKISEIGAAVGYDNDKHFMKTFRSFCGMSPSEYRRREEAARKNSEKNGGGENNERK